MVHNGRWHGRSLRSIASSSSEYDRPHFTSPYQEGSPGFRGEWTATRAFLLNAALLVHSAASDDSAVASLVHRRGFIHAAFKVHAPCERYEPTFEKPYVFFTDDSLGVRREESFLAILDNEFGPHSEGENFRSLQKMTDIGAIYCGNNVLSTNR